MSRNRLQSIWNKIETVIPLKHRRPFRYGNLLECLFPSFRFVLFSIMLSDSESIVDGQDHGGPDRTARH